MYTNCIYIYMLIIVDLRASKNVNIINDKMWSLQVYSRSQVVVIVCKL